MKTGGAVMAPPFRILLYRNARSRYCFGMQKHSCVNPRNDIPVENLRAIFSYDPETGILKKNGRRVGWKHPLGYRYVQIGAVQYKEHRVIWALHYGEWPKGQIDHVNHVKDDNRIRNLRDVCPSQNQRNKPRGGMRKDNTSGFPGVIKRPGRFIAVARYGGKKVHIGSFKTAEKAFEARNAFLAERCNLT